MSSDFDIARSPSPCRACSQHGHPCRQQCFRRNERKVFSAVVFWTCAPWASARAGRPPSRHGI